MFEPLALESTDAERTAHYEGVLKAAEAILEGEDDWVSAMATISCELHHAFSYYNWTGFYRVVAPRLLKVGPCQGGHGCLEISFDRGVCGAAARTKTTQLVPDVHAFPGHIACASSTQSEVVVPVVAPDGHVIAVFDVDSDDPAAFRDVDAKALETLCKMLGARFEAEARF